MHSESLADIPSGDGDKKTRFLNENLGNLIEILKGLNTQWIDTC